MYRTILIFFSKYYIRRSSLRKEAVFFSVSDRLGNSCLVMRLNQLIGRVRLNQWTTSSGCQVCQFLISMQKCRPLWNLFWFWVCVWYQVEWSSQCGRQFFFKLVLNWEYLKRWGDEFLILKCFSKVFEFWFIATWNYTKSNFLLRTGRLKKNGHIICCILYFFLTQVYKSLLLIQNNVKK